MQESARRYLGVEHGHQVQAAHTETIDAVRAIARRSGQSAWRLIGLKITPSAVQEPMSLDDFIVQRDLDGWSESEVLQMYQEAFPLDRRTHRREKLRQRQIDLIQQLHMQAAETPSPADLVTGWFDGITTSKLHAAGIWTLGDLHARIHLGGRWFADLPGVGQTKAQRIERHLRGLLPDLAAPPKRVFKLLEGSNIDLTEGRKRAFLDTANTQATPDHKNGSEALYSRPEIENGLSIAPGMEFLPSPTRGLDAPSDLAAVDAWIRARSGSVATEKSFRREAHRLMLWLQYERGGLDFKSMTAEDCSAYVVFLAHVPAHWISRRRARPGEAGWAPFRGQLTAQSQRQALALVGALFNWLHATSYIHGSPWARLNMPRARSATATPRNVEPQNVKRFSDVVMNKIMCFIEAQPPSPARDRIRFIFRFVQAVGLRPGELLQTRLGDVQKEQGEWFLRIAGQSARTRMVAIPGQALAALHRYIGERGWDGIESAPPDAPLLSNVSNPMTPVSYPALYKHVRSWVARAVAAADLPVNDGQVLSKASTYWLRHTFGTQGLPKGVSVEVSRAQLGQGPSTLTAERYKQAPLDKYASQLDKAFGQDI